MKDLKLISDDELYKYIDFRSELEVKRGDFSTKEAAYKHLIELYKQYAIEDNKDTRELWLNDYVTSYQSELEEMESLNTLKEAEENKDHYNYKISYDVYNAKKEDFKEGVVEKLVEAGSLLIAGKSNAGKSHLAAAIIREHVKINPSLKVEVFYEDEFHELTYEESLKETKRLKALDMIVMDDVGAIGLGKDKRELTKGVIFHFMREAKNIILCSNGKMTEVYDTRTASKIIGSCTVVEMETSTGTRKKETIKI